MDIEFKFEDFKLEKRLGEGTFGETYKATDKAGHVYALKFINPERSGYNYEDFSKEIDIIRKISSTGCNRNVVCYYGSFQANVKGKDYYIVVTEYIDGMDLLDFIRNVDISTDIKLVWDLIEQLVSGLTYIHSKNIAHRDIKLENIMVDTSGDTTKDKYVYKYIDFGLSCLDQKCSDPNDKTVGTLLYAPPEKIVNSEIGPYYLQTTLKNTLITEFAHDVWSLGVVLFLIVNSKYPFPSFTTQEKAKEIAINKLYYKSNYTLVEPDLNTKIRISIINNIVDMLLTYEWNYRPKITSMFRLIQLENEKYKISKSTIIENLGKLGYSEDILNNIQLLPNKTLYMFYNDYLIIDAAREQGLKYKRTLS